LKKSFLINLELNEDIKYTLKKMDVQAFFKQDNETIKETLTPDLMMKMTRTNYFDIDINFETLKHILSSQSLHVHTLDKSGVFFCYFFRNSSIEFIKIIFEFLKERMSYLSTIPFYFCSSSTRNPNLESVKYVFDEMTILFPTLFSQRNILRFVHDVTSNKNKEVIKFIFEKSKELFPDIILSNSYNIFSDTMINTELDSVKYILEELKDSKLEKKINSFSYITCRLAENKNLHVVKYVFDFLKKYLPEIITEDISVDETFFHAVVYNTNIECVKYILENELNEEFFLKNEIIGYNFISAIASGEYENVEYIYSYVEKMYPSVLIQKEKMVTIVFQKLIDQSNLKTVTFILDKIKLLYPEFLIKNKKVVLNRLDDLNIAPKAYMYEFLKNN